MSAAFAAPAADAPGDAVISIRELTKRFGELIAVTGEFVVVAWRFLRWE
jgi:hypothetical protein